MTRLGLLLALAACAPPPELTFAECPDYRFESQFTYAFAPTERTPSGIATDRGDTDVRLDRIDEVVARTEACLAESFGSPPRIPPGVARAADCLDETFALPIARECLGVMVPDDWELACDGRQQVLPARAPDVLCRAKGLEPTVACPCRWRAGIQDGRVLVTTPDLRLLRDPLIRLATGCNNPWAHPLLSRCAMPDTEPR